MKAFLFAAGLGTRLKPITETRPKALAEIQGVPLVEIALRKLRAAGVTEVVVNVHHFADMLESFLKSKDFGLKILLSNERQLLLDTGGGLLNAADFFDDGKPFFAINVDVVTNLHLQKIYQAHLSSGALATLAVQRRTSTRNLLFDNDMRLCGWQNTVSGETKMPRPIQGEALIYSFSGIQVINPELLGIIQKKEEAFKSFSKEKPFSIISIYLALANDYPLLGFDHSEDFWSDVGTPVALEAVNQMGLEGIF